MHDTSLRMCMVDPDARAHGKDMRVRMAILRTCAWLLTAQVYYWQSCDPDIDVKMPSRTKGGITETVIKVVKLQK